MSAELENGADRRSSNAVRTIVFLSRRFEQACNESGLSLPQYRLLLFLRDGPKRAGELAARIAIKRPTLTSLVTSLEKNGQLRREAVERDGRGIHIELTAKGLAAVERTEAHLTKLMDQLAAQGSRDQILDSLDELAGIIDREIEAQIR